MKKAIDVADEILSAVNPAPGVAIVVTERDAEQNWYAKSDPLTHEQLGVFSATLGSLQQSDPKIDWSGVTQREHGKRSVRRWRDAWNEKSGTGSTAG